MIKSIAAIAILSLTLAFGACSDKGQQARDANDIHAAFAESHDNSDEAVSHAPGKIGSHLCGAPTKAGGKCARKVSDREGKDAKCFQHRS